MLTFNIDIALVDNTLEFIMKQKTLLASSVHLLLCPILSGLVCEADQVSWAGQPAGSAYCSRGLLKIHFWIWVFGLNMLFAS